MALTEYDVCFATKEYLFDNGYIIVTWNPPGSQGTFTIPNPEKDPAYRGQTGSESPDLIAIKDKEMLFVEAKDNINSSYNDIIKLKNMLSNPKRKSLLFKICHNQMLALGKDIDFECLNIRYAVAVPYEENIKSKYSGQTDLTIFSVRSKIVNWDNKIIDGNLKMSDIYEINEDTI